MNIFIIGPSRSAKTPIANLVAKELGIERISASDWIRQSVFAPPDTAVTIEEKQRALEEITLISQQLLKINPNNCIDYIRCNYPDFGKKNTSYVLEGFRNPRDFLTLFNPKYDLVVLIKYPSSPLYPLTFETEGLTIIEHSVGWFVKCGIMSDASVMYAHLNNFSEVETIAEMIVRWSKLKH